MNCVGIDVSKGKSMIAVMRPFGEVVVSPFEVRHTASELSELARLLKNLDGETRVVMESTGNYHALVAFAGIDAPPYQSGQIDVRSRSISKRGSASLRRTLFLVMGVLLQCAPMDEPVYQFMNKKRSEGKPYRVYMMASANKFLRIYYASVKAYLDSLEHD